MSAALSSARRRRAGPEAVAPAPGVRQTNPQPSFPGAQIQPNIGSSSGLTLQQVIDLVDKRLNTLEDFMQNSVSSGHNVSEEFEFKTIMDEYNSRFDIIADELASMKDILLKLQSYTMEVNKTLMQDRIRILSDVPTPLEKALAEEKPEQKENNIQSNV
jgi:hypothetical protein